ncbi:MAG: SDR family oxidoreductase [Melioribacteraceae bacterium]|nr:SDR family oxidoreductase [Melioribacteraceae bacterium]
MKTVFITGCSTGIGKETAKLFQQNGWNVAATMRNPEKETELIHLENVKCFLLDVTDRVSIDNTVQNAIGHFGAIDVLVNNAGIGTKGLFEAATLEDARRQFDVNVFGVMNVMWAVLPHFRKRKEGTIINISSQAGFMGVPLNCFYNATKFALEGLSESLMYELSTINVSMKLIELAAVNSNFLASTQFFENPELKEYEVINNTVIPKMKEYLGAGESPSVVATEVYKAATDGTNKLRYLAGNAIEMSQKQRQTLPFETFSQVVKETFGI